MRHHDPLVTKPLQHRVVWKREVVRKIVVDLFFRTSIQTDACMQLHAHAHAHRRAHVRANKKKLAENERFARASMLQCMNVYLRAMLLNL